MLTLCLAQDKEWAALEHSIVSCTQYKHELQEYLGVIVSQANHATSYAVIITCVHAPYSGSVMVSSEVPCQIMDWALLVSKFMSGLICWHRMLDCCSEGNSWMAGSTAPNPFVQAKHHHDIKHNFFKILERVSR
jgi:hypothetical protein